MGRAAPGLRVLKRNFSVSRSISPYYFYESTQSLADYLRGCVGQRRSLLGVMEVWVPPLNSSVP